MLDDPNLHQTWPPPLLKIENDKKFNKKILKNPVKGQLLQTLGKWYIYDPL